MNTEDVAGVPVPTWRIDIIDPDGIVQKQVKFSPKIVEQLGVHGLDAKDSAVKYIMSGIKKFLDEIL